MESWTTKCAHGIAAECGFQTVVCRPRMDAGPATVFRLFGAGCDTLHVAAECGFQTVLGAESGTDMRLQAKLRGDRWDFLRWCLGNHYVVAPGDVREELLLLSKWLGITVHET
jgi:L-fucose isomerase-like protein